MSVSSPDITIHLLKVFSYYLLYFIHYYNFTCELKLTGGSYMDHHV